MTPEEIKAHLIIGSLSIAMGLLSFLITRKKWKYLVDPPEEGWWFYNISFSKKFGKKFFGIDKGDFIAMYQFMGIMGLLAGGYSFYKVIKYLYF